MVTQKAPPKAQPPKVVFEVAASGMLLAIRERHVFRFLLDDGQTVDVICDRADSDVSAAVLAHTKATKIEGVARLALYE